MAIIAGKSQDEFSAAAQPACRHFGPCGGCQLQNITYERQIQLKSERVKALLGAAELALPELQVHRSRPYGYRNRIRLSLAVVDDQLRAGYLTSAAASGQSPGQVLGQVPGQVPSFLPISECPIAAPILWHAAEQLVELLNEQPAVWLRDPVFRLDQLELFTVGDESALQFTLFARSPARNPSGKVAHAFAERCDRLRELVPQLAAAGISMLPVSMAGRSRRAEMPRPAVSWGAPGLLYRVPGSGDPGAGAEELAYWIPRTAFFQVNRFLPPELLGLVSAQRLEHLVAERSLAFDLFAGVGLFARALARSFSRVVAAEIAEPAATALGSTGLSNLRAVRSGTLEFLRSAVLDRERPSLVVLDPPRTGGGPEVCVLVARLAPEAILYVSCAPDRLALDLMTLVASGYSLAELHLFDLFPQTSHIETAAILRRTA